MPVDPQDAIRVLEILEHASDLSPAGPAQS
jgi:hypothetical protein